jgi:hypothetical protein
MRNAIFLMLLAVVSGSAAAAWEAIGGNDIETVTSYADLATIHKSGNMVKMWSLLDYETARVRVGKVYRSIKAEFEYNCKEDRQRVLSYSWHSENMGGGAIVISNTEPSDWSPIPLGAVAETLWRLACEK